MPLTLYKISWQNKLARMIWEVVRLFLYRTSPSAMHWWRRFLLRCFGAKIGSGAHPYPTAIVWAPWNLTMHENSCLSHGVICYNVAQIYLGKNATVSQYCHLCTATHDYTDPSMQLMVGPIRIEDNAWITADVFVAPGVTIGEGSVVNARSSVFSDIEPWKVAKGYPAVCYKERDLKGVRK